MAVCVRESRDASGSSVANANHLHCVIICSVMKVSECTTMVIFRRVGKLDLNCCWGWDGMRWNLTELALEWKFIRTYVSLHISPH